MKILWFSPAPLSSGIKGGGSWIIDAARSLSKRHDIDLYYASEQNVNKLKIEKFENLVSLQLPNKQPVWFIKNVRKIFSISETTSIKDYYKAIELVKPQIIQVFGSEHDWTSICQVTNLPILLHLQGIYHCIHKKWFAGISKVDACKYSSLKATILRETFYHDYQKGFFRMENEKFLLKNINYFIGRTNLDKLIIELFSPTAKYFHCDEMLREEFFKYQWNYHSTKGKIKIISILRDAPYKGLETIVETIQFLEKECRYNIEWNIVGLTSESQSVRILKKKYKKKYPDNIYLLGRLDSLSIINYLLNSDMFVHPSHIENSSNSVCEAMLLGMPVIAMFVGGLNSIISNNKTGILIQEGDPYSLAGMIIKLYENHEYAVNIGKNARSEAIKRHDPEKIIDTLIKVYDTIVNDD
ncbi:MAG: glycosyltransferase family 4 protein [Bacteroidales bacterium]